MYMLYSKSSIAVYFAHIKNIGFFTCIYITYGAVSLITESVIIAILYNVNDKKKWNSERSSLMFELLNCV